MPLLNQTHELSAGGLSTGAPVITEAFSPFVGTHALGAQEILTGAPVIQQPSRYADNFIEPNFRIAGSAGPQYDVYEFESVAPRWKEDTGTVTTETMILAKFATEKPQRFIRWHLDAISGKPYPEDKLVSFQGKWYRPEHIKDEIAEIRKRS